MTVASRRVLSVFSSSQMIFTDQFSAADIAEMILREL